MMKIVTKKNYKIINKLLFLYNLFVKSNNKIKPFIKCDIILSSDIKDNKGNPIKCTNVTNKSICTYHYYLLKKECSNYHLIYKSSTKHIPKKDIIQFEIEYRNNYAYKYKSFLDANIYNNDKNHDGYLWFLLSALTYSKCRNCDDVKLKYNKNYSDMEIFIKNGTYAICNSCEGLYEKNEENIRKINYNKFNDICNKNYYDHNTNYKLVDNLNLLINTITYKQKLNILENRSYIIKTHKNSYYIDNYGHIMSNTESINERELIKNIYLLKYVQFDILIKHISLDDYDIEKIINNYNLIVYNHHLTTIEKKIIFPRIIDYENQIYW